MNHLRRRRRLQLCQRRRPFGTRQRPPFKAVYPLVSIKALCTFKRCAGKRPMR
jgi:hypothetical protein